MELTLAEAALWAAFDVLCGPTVASIKVQWVRLKCCRSCLEQGISCADLKEAQQRMGLYHHSGGGEQLLIDEVVRFNGDLQQVPLSRNLQTQRPNMAERAAGIIRLFEEMAGGQ